MYYYSLADGSMDTLDFIFERPNGVASSPDGSMLFVGDIAASKVYRAGLVNGEAGPVELFADLGALGLAGPDGMAVASDGRVFQALYRSQCLVVLDPDGEAVGTLPTGPLTSNCVFAADGKTLYITADKKLKRVTVPGLPQPN